MKRPRPDIGDITRQEFIQNVGTVRKLLRLWDTVDEGGTEVLHARRYFYPIGSRPANYEKLFRYLGAYQDIEDNFESKGLKSAWMFFNKNKTSKLPTDGGGNDVLSNYVSFVNSNLDTLWWDNADGARPATLTLRTAIVIQPSVDLASANPTLVKIEDIIAQPLTDAGRTQAVIDNFSDLWQTSRVVQQGAGYIHKGTTVQEFSGGVTIDEDDLSPDDPWLSCLARYALGDSEISPVVLDSAIGLNIARKFGLSAEPDNIANTIALTIEIPYYAFTSSSTLVNSVAQDLFRVTTDKAAKNTVGRSRSSTPSRRVLIDNATLTIEAILKMDTSDLEDNPSLITRDYILWETASTSVNPAFDSIWHNGKVKADALRNPRDYGVTYEDLSSYLLSIIDTDYKKEDVPFWKKAVALVVFIVAVIYFGPTSGAKLVSLLKAIGFAAIVLTVITLALSLAGATEWAGAFAAASEFLEPLILVASVVLLVGGLQRSLANAAGDTAIDKAISLGKDYATSLVQDIMAGATDLAALNLTSSAAVGFATKLANILNIINNNKLESIQDRNKDLAAEHEKIQEELLLDADLSGFMNIYARPATADWSTFAEQFDLPYERTGGSLHLGNIQRTTKQAIRKADYSDPVFANITLV